MQKKALTPRLPTDDSELILKGFEYNFSGSKKFITDGHSVFRTADCVKSIIPKVRLCTWRSKSEMVKEEAIMKAWTPIEQREQVAVFFVGCGKVKTFEEDKIAAVLRDNTGRFMILNAYILGFAIAATKADSLAVSKGPKHSQEAVAVFKDGRMVGAIMPMRYTVKDLEAYDLNSPVVDLKPEGH